MAEQLVKEIAIIDGAEWGGGVVKVMYDSDFYHNDEYPNRNAYTLRIFDADGNEVYEEKNHGPELEQAVERANSRALIL